VNRGDKPKGGGGSKNMNNKSNGQEAKIASVPFYCIRNISAPEDTANGRTVYSGQLPIQSIVGIPDDENVREYLVTGEGKKKHRRTQVHRAISETLREHPDIFTLLNSGVVIVAGGVEIDEKSRTLKLLAPSLINGSQTQGEVSEFLENQSPTSPIHIKFELIITEDSDLRAEISIARNFQNDVASISIAGRRGKLDELEEAFQKSYPELRLKKSESQWPSGDIVFTEKLLQVIAALLPDQLWYKSGDPSKVYTYANKATCLKDFERIHDAAKDPKNPEHEKLAEVYEFYLGIAAEAFGLYEKWKKHQGFKGTGLRALVRDEDDNIEEVPDGIVFPILAALSEFGVKSKVGWRISPPAKFDESKLIETAKRTYMESAKSNPSTMGKTAACYSALQQITAIYRELFAH
jgi:hypothetical protein